MNSNVIYQISSPNGKRYIGSAKNFGARKRVHLHQLKNGKHHSRSLQRAWLKYDGHLEFSVIVACEEKDLFFYEQIVLDGLKPEYNVSPSASGTRGLKWSPEAIERIRRIRKITGSKLSVDARKKLADSARQHLHSAEAKEKSAAAHRTPESRAAKAAAKLGHIDSPEVREKKRLALLGRPVSKETRAKIGAKHIGNIHALGCSRNEETRAKMSAAQKAAYAARIAQGVVFKPALGHHPSKETRATISAKLKGRKRSPEAIAKHRATMAARRNSVDKEITR